MARTCELAGDRLIALPDGEIGERSDRYPAGDRSQWVAVLAGRLAGEGSLFDVVDEGTMNDEGFPVDFDSTARMRPRVGPAELADRLEFGYDTFGLQSWPHFERLRVSTGRPDLRMQVGLPTGFGAAALLGPLRALRHAPAFAACVAREANRAAQAIGAGNLLFQIEAPAEVVAAHRLPRPAVGVPTGPIIDLVVRLPPTFPSGSTSASRTSATRPPSPQAASTGSSPSPTRSSATGRRRTNSPTCIVRSPQGSHRHRPIPPPTEPCAPWPSRLAPACWPASSTNSTRWRAS